MSTIVRGFTLIESIIYVALTAFLLGSVLISTYPILTGAERTGDRITVDAETVFVLRKIDWALSSLGSVSLPVSGGTGDTLTVTTAGGTVLSFTNASGVISLSTNGGAPEPLTASRVVISNLSFTNTAPVGGVPRAIDVSFDVNGSTVGPVRTYARF